MLLRILKHFKSDILGIGMFSLGIGMGQGLDIEYVRIALFVGMIAIIVNLITELVDVQAKSRINTAIQFSKINEKQVALNELPDLTREFSELMDFISAVAIDIRLYSAYSNGQRDDGGGRTIDSWSDPNTPYDLMYLTNILHNLSMFNDDNIKNIIFACNHHIDSFERYLLKESGDKNIKGNPADTFERHKYYVNLNMAIDIFKRIKAKCTEAIQIKEVGPLKDAHNGHNS